MASRMAGIQRMLQSRGMDAGSARQAAARMIDGGLRQQAMVISFEKLFYLSGILFLCVLPLVFFLKMPKDAEKIDVHVEM
jgi:DHA2 family multidrug resistance protein